ncbi:acyl-CoA thioesterase [Marispirochaeta sp.]|jgi:acyl-CoA hydrolase|uniref:acyl-CoA thioesterase n=1 Tax=Marispirochaeta sp. TaxID=2038653 RepID=UPI0029C88626|nr:acyl-CoA thioesterase [Marispirochaeta sp.]
MNTYTIVRMEHLNHHGNLFGGQMLKWVDENAWLTAAKEYPGCMLVTRAMDDIAFRNPVPVGAILRFDTRETRHGRTSLTYSVDVWSDEPGAREEKLVFSTSVTFACVDCEGNKAPVPPRGGEKPGACRD